SIPVPSQSPPSPSQSIPTAPFDSRFPNQNQTRNCWQNYLGTARGHWGHLGTPGDRCDTPGDTWGHLGTAWGHWGHTWGHLGTPGDITGDT
uniref:Uncharacterized protein n=1 Tax=Cyanistes caeruleus TaxID=156563 RepID=A0A8C0U0E4_CYACU